MMKPGGRRESPGVARTIQETGNMNGIDQASFGPLVEQARTRLEATIRKLVGHPDEVDDLAQQAVLQAWEKRRSFAGDSEFSTWLCSIGANLAVDFLRKQKRWRVRAQVAYANECLANESLAAEIGQTYARPDFAYDVFEHVGYCLTCVGRAMNPDEYAAVVLREVLGLGNREAAQALGISESVLRHRLAAGRRVMTENFEGLCSLVNKQGVCYQCKGLRDIAPEDRRGPAVPVRLELDERLRTVATLPAEEKTRALHDVFWRRTAQLEAEGRGSTEASGCGEDTEVVQ